MAYVDETKKSIKGLKPIEAGFVKYFEMIENAFKNINDSMGGLNVPDPNRNKTTRVRREPNRPYYAGRDDTPFRRF
tara:strand:+ start:1447 stop:1674 length:228 start_codon:yes stop_codon:yes gene_type:complete